MEMRNIYNRKTEMFSFNDICIVPFSNPLVLYFGDFFMDLSSVSYFSSASFMIFSLSGV